MFVDELPSLRVLLLVSVAVRPVAFVHVEFVEELRPETKIDNRALEVSASIALKGDYKGLQITGLLQQVRIILLHSLHHT